MDNRWSLENGNECFRFKEKEVLNALGLLLLLRFCLLPVQEWNIS